ncbi:MAG: hypothetical protein KF817_03125 [Phycisphaeraceae bacterium]|nr:hypothetical protein [Phycisphaeraceae bacterium]
MTQDHGGPAADQHDHRDGPTRGASSFSASAFSFTSATGARARSAGERVRVFVLNQPGWISRVALLAIAVILLVPFVLLVLLAIAAGAVIFAIALVIDRVRRLGRRIMSLLRPGRDREGRINVRVVERR